MASERECCVASRGAAMFSYCSSIPWVVGGCLVAKASSNAVSRRIPRSVNRSMRDCCAITTPASCSTFSFLLITVVSASHLLSVTLP